MKKYAWLIYLISCFILGFVFTFLVYIGLWSTLIDGFRSVPIWLYFVLVPVVFYVTLTIHEMGHLIAFVIQGVKIRALYLTIFVFYKDNKGWHVTIKPKLWVLFGGLVVPDLPPIQDKEDMKRLSRIFSIALITAPIVTIAFMSISIISFLLVWILGSGTLGFGILTVSTIYITLLSILYIYTFGLNTKHLYGDFVAYRKMKEDPLFQFAQLYQYQTFALHEDKQATCLYEQATTLIENQHKLKHNLFLMMTLSAYLEGVIHEHQSTSKKIDKLLLNIPIRRYSQSPEGLSLVYLLAEYYYVKSDVKKAYHLIEKANQYAGKQIPKKLSLYLYNRAQHIMHIKYHRSFLNNHDNIYIGHAWLFEVLEDPYEAAKKEHKKLPFKAYVCHIPDEEKNA